MPSGIFGSELAKKVAQGKGTREFVVKTITSSAITTAAQDLSSVATGRFYIEDIILETDATGVAGATNFCVGTNNASGLTGGTTGNSLAETAVSGLGANKTISIKSGSDDSSTDRFMTVSGITGVLEAGKKLVFSGTSSAGTGAGTIRVTVVLMRIDPGATITAV